MTPEAAHLLAGAERKLDDAVRIARVDIPGIAAREAYTAAFNAAQAAIFDRQGRVVRAHDGVRRAFDQIARDDPMLGAELAGLVAEACAAKALADDGTNPTKDAGEAKRAIADAWRLIERVRVALGDVPGAER